MKIVNCETDNADNEDDASEHKLFQLSDELQQKIVEEKCQ